MKHSFSDHISMCVTFVSVPSRGMGDETFHRRPLSKWVSKVSVPSRGMGDETTLEMGKTHIHVRGISFRPPRGEWVMKHVLCRAMLTKKKFPSPSRGMGDETLVFSGREK